ncbi:glycogen debranching protein GlgX [Motilimonas sp. KMU-193]|uniref:glycogen debranching protein GlgX n=1 Tax=Motilimonas sp. KMU-193 TaxID=3388668 RepID=UPI00396B13C1
MKPVLSQVASQDATSLSLQSMPFRQLEGRILPLGAELTDAGCNFSIYSNCHRIWLVLFDQHEQEQTRFLLTEKRGKFWSTFIQGVKVGQLYGYIVEADHNVRQNEINEKLLIDPYAKALNKPVTWSKEVEFAPNAHVMAKSVVVDDSFDWQGVTKPNLKASEIILYELHVKGFTWLNSAVPSDLRGTYLGLSHPAVIAHLTALGIKAVQIMPVASFMAEPRLMELGLTNYWGYNPVNFFAPDPRYAIKDAVSEFKTMVRQFHQAGIEVILDVVFNHTAEGGDGGPILSYKGLAENSYYYFEHADNPDIPTRHANFTGCGNTVNLDLPWALKLTLDALRYWSTEMQVDGFRFDLAVTLARERGAFEPYSAFFKTLFQDPILSQAKLIAEPWDIGPGGYRLGQFPSNWYECNDRYRDNIRAFWRGDSGQIAEFATRILGSRDIFPKNKRSIHTSVNYICYHDGFTLEDLVSYEHRHNHANGEESRDGHGHNLSSNSGVEGPSFDLQVIQRREQRKRNLIATLFLSQGTPHFLAGDEMGRTQGGNNNAYCQDNAVSWVDWNLSDLQRQQLAFCKQMIKLRLQSSIFSQLSLADDGFQNQSEIVQARWYHPDGHFMQKSQWHSATAQVLQLELESNTEHWLLIFNASEYDVSVTLPELKDTLVNWQCVFDTSVNEGRLCDPNCVMSPRSTSHAHSLMLLTAKEFNPL